MKTVLPALARLFVLLAISGASAAGAQDNGWTLQPDARIELQPISAQTTTRDDGLVVDGEATSLRGQLGAALEKRGVRLRIEAEAKDVFTGSNEPAREREGYRLTLSLGHAF